MTDQLQRLREVMDTLRVECPWDAEQTHESLVNHLIEETCEVVDALEAGDDTELQEELGDLLLQVYFHARIAQDEGRFDLDDVAGGVADKLIRRHPYIYGDESVPADVWGSWEARKRAEKGRKSSLEGIAQSMSSVARAAKVISRVRSLQVPVALPEEPIETDVVGQEMLALVARAHASGIDPDAALRRALRQLEADVRAAETTSRTD